MIASIAELRAVVVPIVSSLLITGSLAACGAPAPSPDASAPGPGATTPVAATPSASTPVATAAAGIGIGFVRALATGDTAAAQAMEDPTMKAAAPAAALGQLWSQLVAQFGAYGGTGEVATAAAGAYTNATVATFFAKNTVPLIVTVDKDGQVAGLHLGQPGPASSAIPSGAASAAPTGSATQTAPPSPSPAAYVHPDAFTETEVTVGSGRWALPGTLSMPKGSGPFPAVVLVAGSGANDRDETIGANAPLRDLAWGLASDGIAVLRYDKRTKAHQAEISPIAASITVKEEVVDDAVLAVDLLRSTPGVDPGRVAIAGHSLGGYLAPRIATEAGGKVAGIALLEASISPLEDLILAQLTYLASDEGGADPQATQLLDGLAAKVQRVKSGDLAAATPGDLPLGVPAAYWLDLRSYDPGTVAAGLGVPILIVQGGRDYQVPPTEAEAWRTSLAGVPGVTITLYPALDHLMLAGSGPSRPADYAVPGHVDAGVVRDLAAWVNGLR